MSNTLSIYIRVYLKAHTHAKIIEESVIFNFCAAHAHLPVKGDIETKLPYFLLFTWLSEIKKKEFRLYI